MSDEYPEEEDLEKITNWPHRDFIGWMEFIKSVWWMPDWGWDEEDGVYNISTGGWSGNESIISAMRSNFPLWGLHWQVHRTGGHYEFKSREAQDRPDAPKPAKLIVEEPLEEPCWGCGEVAKDHPNASGCQEWHES